MNETNMLIAVNENGSTEMCARVSGRGRLDLIAMTFDFICSVNDLAGACLQPMMHRARCHVIASIAHQLENSIQLRRCALERVMGWQERASRVLCAPFFPCCKEAVPKNERMHMPVLND